MASFDVRVRRINVYPHDNADNLALGTVDDYQVVVWKENWKTGDLGVYIPEQAIVPEKIIADMQLEGRLSGEQHNRVKAIKLRGKISQGLLYRPPVWPDHWTEGLDVGAELGIEKWEPPIPNHLSGKVVVGPFFTRSYDVESLQKFPNTLHENEEVVATEKLHGTCAIFIASKGTNLEEPMFWVTSKGIAQRGFVLEEEPGNTYWRAAREFGIEQKIRSWMLNRSVQYAILYGEIVGVQDLMYGLKRGRIGFYAFDLWYVGMGSSRGRFLDYGALTPSGSFFDHMRQLEVPTVPLLYAGGFSKDVAYSLARGKSLIADHMREGVVIRPAYNDDRDGDWSDYRTRPVLKIVSPEYLTRRGEATEFE